MFGKHGTVWQVGLAVLGLLIVGIVLFGPHGRATSLVAAPAADVANNNSTTGTTAHPVVVVQQPDAQQPGSDQSGSQAAAPADGSASSDTGAGAQAGSGSASASNSTSARAGTGSVALPALPAVPAVPAVGSVGRTLFLDNFASDPLGLGLPTGWLLADPTGSSSGGGLGGLPIVGGLLGGLTSSTTSLVPSVVNDGTHVLSRQSGSWSHLAAGPMTVDSTASASVKMLGRSSGFVGVAGRFQDVNNSIMCGLSGPNTLQLWQVVNGQQQLLASQPVSAALNVFHTIKMVMQGSQMSCSLDGGSMLQATGTLTSPGRIGLVALGDATSEFTNVLSTALA